MLYGLIGIKGSGKSTAAQIMKNLLGRAITREVMLADKLKNLCCEQYGFSRRDLEDRKVKEFIHEPRLVSEDDARDFFRAFGVHSLPTNLGEVCAKLTYHSPREFMQKVGTDLLRAHDEDIHIKNLALDGGVHIIVSDVRFPNEADFIKRSGGKLIYISNPELEKQLLLNYEDAPISETIVTKMTRKMANAVVTNHGVSIPELTEQLAFVLKS